ncbi:MAG TPA: hypothetical protein VGM83_12975 [Devosiaceae bacterium]|jgi:hypothetical protein
MEKIFAAFPKRPLTISNSGVPAATGPLIVAVLLLGLLIIGAIWVGPNLIRDFTIMADPVEVPDADINNGECSSYRGFLTNCSADIAYEINGQEVKASLSYLFVDFSSGDYEVSVMRSGSHPTLATLSLGLDMIWNRAVVAGLIGLAMLLGVISLLRNSMRTARFKRQLQDDVELVPVPAMVTGTRKPFFGMMGSTYSVSYNDGQKSRTAHSGFKRKEAPFMLGFSGKQAVVLGAMPKQGGMMIILDEALTRVDFTPAERMALEQAANAA